MPNRIIKESICTSETLAECSIGANLLFDRLTTKADDHGCFDARVKIIRGGVFPLMMGKVKESDIEKWLNELEAMDCVRTWNHTNGIRYGWFPSWANHNDIKSIHSPKTPCPPWMADDSGSDPRLASETKDAFKRIDCAIQKLGENANYSEISQEANTSKSTIAKYMKTKSSTPKYTSVHLGTDSTHKNPNPNPNPNLKKHIGQKAPSAPGWAGRFEIIWGKYPRKLKKHEAGLKFKKQVLTEQDWSDIQRALENYIADTEHIKANGHPDREWQHGSTWFNHAWKDYVEMAKAETWAESYDRRKKEGIL